jgi:glycosyltransferase involved in cell wall biosynthesis
MKLHPADASSQEPVTLVHVMTVPSCLGFIQNQLEFLRARGFALHAITSPGETLTRFAAEQGVAGHAVAMQRRITPCRDLISLWRLYRIFRKIRPQVVHAHTPKGGLLGSLAAWLAGVPARIYTIHGLPMMTATGLKRQLLRWSERISCRCAHRVLCVSQSIREEAVRERLCPAEKIKVLGHGSSSGVDAMDRFNPAQYVSQRQEIRRRHAIPEDALVVGYVGRIVRDKGIVELVHAWQTLRERFADLHLLLVGPFEPQDPVPREAEAVLRADPRIHLAGETRQTPPYYTAMDVCVLPTYREGLPNVLLEAAAMCVPIVATRIPGCTDATVEDATGLLVPPRDAAALADALGRLLDSPPLRRRLGQAGRERVLRDFRPQAIRQAVYDQYLELLKGKGLGAPSANPRSREERRAA